MVATLVIIILSVVVHQAPGTRKVRSKECGTAPIFQESSMDILNIDVSKHELGQERVWKVVAAGVCVVTI